MPKGYLLHHVFKESIFNQQTILVFTLNKKAETFGPARFLGSLLYRNGKCGVGFISTS